MPGQDLIVIGASAGGVEAVTALLSGLTPGLPAAVLVVVHIPSYQPSFLPAVLNRSGPLPAARSGPLLSQLTSQPTRDPGVDAMASHPEGQNAAIERDLVDQAADRKQGQSSIYSCPECGGHLWQLGKPRMTEFQCHVGHT